MNLHGLLSSTELTFSRFLFISLQSAYPKDIGLINIRSLDAMLRTLVLGKMGRNGDEAVIAEARKRFEAHCGGATIPADLRGPVRK